MHGFSQVSLFRAKVAVEVLEKGATPAKALENVTQQLPKDRDFMGTEFAPSGDFLQTHYRDLPAREAALAELTAIAKDEDVKVEALLSRVGAGLSSAVHLASEGRPMELRADVGSKAEVAEEKSASIKPIPPASANAKIVELRFAGTDSVAIKVDRDLLCTVGRFGKAPILEGAKTEVANALAREGVTVAPEHISDDFVRTLYSATRNGDGGTVKKKDVPDGVLMELAKPRIAPATLTLGQQLEEAHAADFVKLKTQFHADIPAEKRFMVALNIRNEAERNFLADSAGIPRENIIFLRDTGSAMKQVPERDHAWIRTGANKDLEKLRKALAGKDGCSVTVLAHYNAGGMQGPMGTSRDKPATIGGLPAEDLGAAIGRSVDGGRLNMFVCGAETISRDVARATGSHTTDVTAVSDGVPIQPHRTGERLAFYYAGPPVASDTGESDAPASLNDRDHSSIRDRFTTRTFVG